MHIHMIPFPFSSAGAEHFARAGVQIAGVANVAGCVNGLQIGLFNIAGRVECGLQIGLFNIINDNGWAPILPIVNGHF